MKHDVSAFDKLPISILQTDLSGVRGYVENLRLRDMDNPKQYLDDHPEIVNECLERIVILSANEHALSFFNAKDKTEIKNYIRTIFTEEALGVLREEISDLSEGKLRFESECGILTLPGDEKFVSFKMSIDDGHEDTWARATVTFTDITAHKLIEQELMESEANYRAIFESANDGIFILDIQSAGIIDVNKKGSEMFCYSYDEMVRLDIDDLSSTDTPHTREDAVQWVKKAMRGEPQRFEWVARDKAGRSFWVEVNLRRAIIGGRYRILAVIRDVNDRKEWEKKLEVLNTELVKSNRKLMRVSLIDSHTGLFNFKHLEDSIDAQFHDAVRYAHPLSIMMTDIDDFRSVNEAHGHAYGDTVLKEFAVYLKHIVRRNDIVARLSGENFAAILPFTDRPGALVLAQRILSDMQSHIFGGHKHGIRLKASIAVTSFPKDECIMCGMDLVTLAEKVMERAKSDGGSRVYSSVNLYSGRNEEPVCNAAKIDHIKNRVRILSSKCEEDIIETLTGFAQEIMLKDHYTDISNKRALLFISAIIREANISGRKAEEINRAFLLRDIGKIAVSDAILSKPGPLTDEEFRQIKNHSTVSTDILRPIISLRAILPLVLYHHERWDGRGYPSQLSGKRIPLGARILALADAFNSLGTDRPYRRSYSHEMIASILKECSGSQFDPELVPLAMKIMNTINAA